MEDEGSVEFMMTSICLVLTAGWIVILFTEVWKIGTGLNLGEMVL